MNYIKHLTAFFDRIAQDRTLNPTHISLYISLFQYWNVNRFQNPISITRDEVMQISKICSKATYHKCMRELHAKGYIRYEPSFNPFKGSMVILFNFSEDPKPVQKKDSSTKKKGQNAGQLLNRQETADTTGTEQALVSSINNTNKTNSTDNSNLDKQAQNEITKKNPFSKNEILKSGTAEKEQPEKKKSFSDAPAPIKNNPKTESREFLVTPSVSSRAQPKDGKPSMEIVKSYFQENSFPELEASKFFNYFSSNGWLVGGRTPMADWQAAAQNWMINSTKFSHTTDTTPPDRARHLSTETQKDYSEPL